MALRNGWRSFAGLTATLLFLLAAAGVNSLPAFGQEAIPFKLTHGFAIVVRGEIGQNRDLSFLVDTGAVPSVISKKLASRLVSDGPRGSFALVDRTIESQYVTVSDVRVGSLRAGRLPMAVVDLVQLGQALGKRIDAVVGLDFFGNASLTIDFKGKTILAGRPEPEPAACYSLGEIVTQEGAPYWVLPVTVNGQTFRMLLDTGADSVGLFRNEATKKLFAASRVGLIAADLTVAGRRFKNQAVVALNAPPAAFEKIDGLLSLAALKVQRMELDPENKCIRW
jgi:predicted aspartyl protease